MELGELLQEKEFRQCKGAEGATNAELVVAFTHFCATFWTIRHPLRGRIKFVLRPAQIQTVESWLDNRYSISLKSRQIGFSTLAAAYCFWLAFFWPDRLIIMLSRTEREAGKLLAKSKYGYKRLPQWMRLRGPELVSDNLLKMVFGNDSSIESLPSGNDPARGEAVFLVVVDEMAFLTNSAEAWAAIEPIADVGGRVILLSTANGEGNIFFDLWTGSQNGTNRFVGIFFPWWAGDESRDAAWYEAKKRDLPDWQLAQEYPSNPEEAFIRSGRPVFDLEAIRAIEIEDPVRGHLKKVPGEKTRIFIEDGGGLSIWDMPEPTTVYAIGADVAEGLGHGDYSSAHVIDVASGAVVAHWHGHIDPDLFGEDVLSSLGLFYNSCIVGVESNNHGLTTLKALQRTKYKNIFRQRRLGARTAPISETLGWRTTTTSKPLAIDELNGAIRDGALNVPCRSTLAEMRTFVRENNGKMHGSPHDDRVMSLAIANQMLKYVWLPEYLPEVKVKRNSLLWWEKLIVRPNKEENGPIGSFNIQK